MGRKAYSKQFKTDAVNLVLKEGYKATEAGKNLGIHEVTIINRNKLLLKIC